MSLRNQGSFCFITLVAAVPLLAGARCAMSSVTPALEVRADAAFQRTVELIKPHPVVSADIAWLIQQVVMSTPEPELDDSLSRWLDLLVGDRFELLVNPDAPGTELPEDPGSGIILFSNYVMAAVGWPEARAIQFLSDYLATDDEVEYILTHQLLVIVWADQTGLVLPDDLRDRRTLFVERMLAEQAADDVSVFTDLYAERAALLLRYAEPTLQEATEWIQVIVDAQEEDGSWGDTGVVTVTFDGQTVSGGQPELHTEAWAMLALRMFLDRY